MSGEYASIVFNIFTKARKKVASAKVRRDEAIEEFERAKVRHDEAIEEFERKEKELKQFAKIIRENRCYDIAKIIHEFGNDDNTVGTIVKKLSQPIDAVETEYD